LRRNDQDKAEELEKRKNSEMFMRPNPDSLDIYEAESE
jgi:hypothetical protein